MAERRAEGSIKGPVDLVFDYNYRYFESSSERQQQLVKLKCEAVLDLPPEGPLLSAFSPELEITVECKYTAWMSMVQTETHDFFGQLVPEEVMEV